MNTEAAGDRAGDTGASAIEVFISYARRDRRACRTLLLHLALLQRQGLIRAWYDGQLQPGDDWNHILYEKMNTSSVVLLLISKNFLASDFCYSKELRHALERQLKGEVRIVPIILGFCDLTDAPFMNFQALPKDAKPIESWADQDEAWADVVARLRGLLEAIQPLRPTKTIVGAMPSRTLLERYRKFSNWLDDIHDFFGAVAGAGGLRRTIRTFTTLTFHLDSFIAYALSSVDLEANRRRYLGAPVVMLCYLFFSIILLIGLEYFSANTVSSSFTTRDAKLCGFVGVCGALYFSTMLRYLTRQKRTFGECAAIVCYVGGSVGIPLWIFLTFLMVLIFLSKLIVGFFEMPVYIALLAVAAIVFILAIPLVILRGVRRFVGTLSLPRIFAFAASVVIFLMMTFLVVQPGNTAFIGSLFCHAMNRRACAERMSAASVRLQPRNVFLWISRVGMLRQIDQSTEALQVAQQGLARHPESKALHVMVGQLLHQSNPGTAEVEYRRALELDPACQDCAKSLGALYVKEKKFSELLMLCRGVLASEHFSEAFQRDCDQWASIALINSQNYESALIHLRRALIWQEKVEDLPSQVRTLNLIGRAHFERGELQQALRYHERALASAKLVDDKPSEALAQDNMATVLERLGRPAESVEHSLEAAKVLRARRPPDFDGALDSLEAALSLSLRYKIWAQAEAARLELEALYPPAYLRLRWRARLAGFRGEQDAAMLYKELARSANGLSPRTQVKMQVIAAAGQLRAHHRSHWPACPGVAITEVAPGSQAEHLGLAVNDIILSYQGTCMYESRDLLAGTGKTQPEESVTLMRWYGDRPQTLKAQGGRLGVATIGF